MYQVKIKKIKNEAILPYKAYESDAGYDIFAAESAVIMPGESALIGTGFAMALPKGTEAQIRPRSGLALNHQVTLLNSPGTIDEGYRGEIKVILINHGKEPFVVKVGMKIAQMVIAPVLQTSIAEVDVLDETARGDAGFGSTGV